MVNKIIHIFLYLLVTLDFYVQSNTDFEDICLLPISLIPKYESIIKPKELVPHFIIKSTPKMDSINLRHQEINHWGHHFGIGIKFENDKWFKKSSYKFELDTGTVWLFKASTITSKRVSIKIDLKRLPKKSQLSYFYYNKYGYFGYNTHGCEHTNFKKHPNLRSCYNCKNLYIEYFEPKKPIKKFDFKIVGWSHTY